MRKIYLNLSILFILIGILLIHSDGYAQDCGCDHTISSSGEIRASDYNISAGDVFCIEAGVYDFFRFFDFQGEADNPLIFKNCGGLVEINADNYSGIQFAGSQYVRLTGTGNDDMEYGIKIASSPNSGLSISRLSTDFEIDHVEITNTGFAGIVAKTDPECDDESAWRGNFVLTNLDLHDNYIHDNNEGEGFYIGYTGSYEQGKEKTCNGETDTLYGHLLKHVKIYNNRVVNISWDGIQVSNTTEDCEVYNNYIENYGTADEDVQNEGIVLGSGTAARVYNNYIDGGTGHGIQNFGLGPVYIYNNIVLDAGERGIYNDRKHAVEPAEPYMIANNTVIDPAEHGIFYNNGQNSVESTHEYYNNLVVNPGVYEELAGLGSHWTDADSDSYISAQTRAAKEEAVIENNYYTLDIQEAGFIDPVHADYRLEENSPAVDSGIDLSAELGYDFDISHYERDGQFDIGAFEHGSSDAHPLAVEVPDGDRDAFTFTVFPNPYKRYGDLHVQVALKHTTSLTVYLMNARAQKTGTLVKARAFAPGIHDVLIKNKMLDNIALKAGIYYLVVQSDNLAKGFKLIVK